MMGQSGKELLNGKKWKKTQKKERFSLLGRSVFHLLRAMHSSIPVTEKIDVVRPVF